MDSFELNKIMGAILGTLLFVMGLGFLAEAIYEPIEDNGAGYALAEPVDDGHGGGTAPVVEIVPIGVLLASASIEDGAKVARKCASCHNFDAGGANKTGPGLYDIIGHQIAANDSFAYSQVLGDLGGSGATWTYEAMNEFLTSPKVFAPGTKMTFAGLRSEKERANLLAYMQTLSESPVPFPEVVEEEPMAADDDAASEEHAAEGDAAAAH